MITSFACSLVKVLVVAVGTLLMAVVQHVSDYHKAPIYLAKFATIWCDGILKVATTNKDATNSHHTTLLHYYQAYTKTTSKCPTIIQKVKKNTSFSIEFCSNCLPLPITFNHCIQASLDTHSHCRCQAQ
jgi:hypothetical protein